MSQKKSKSQRKKEGIPHRATGFGPQETSEIIERLDLIANKIARLSADLHTQPPPKQEAPRSAQGSRSRRIVGGIVSILGVLGFCIAVYQIRPYPVPQYGTSSEPFQGFVNSFSILNSGQLPMRDVDVLCDFTKIVFDGKHTLVTGDGYVASMYRVPDVRPGEPFTVRCPQSWRLYIARDHTFGFVTVGEPKIQPKGNGTPNGSLQNPWLYMPVTRFALLPNGGIGPLNTVLNDESLRELAEPIVMISGMDLTITIHYRVGFTFIPLTRKVRFTASRSTRGELSWRAVPMSEPSIPNGTDEYIALSGLNFVVTNDVPQNRPDPRK